MSSGVLIIHGFAGDKREVETLTEYLIEKGYVVEVPLLAGHGEGKKALSKTTYSNWIDSVENAYLSLSKKCEEVVVIGFSMGGLLAANIWHYGFSALITINTPIYYWNPGRICRNLITDFKFYGRKYIEASTDKPLYSMLQFQKLLSHTKPIFENITCKTMVIQSLDDDTVHYKSADYIFKRVCAQKYLYKVPTGGHLLLKSENSKLICAEIQRFISYSSSVNHCVESASLGIRQSPLGERLTEPTFGPSGTQLLLNC